MTCPKCGYVTFPGLPQCKRCGYPFSRSSGEERGAAPPVDSDDFLIGSVAGEEEKEAVPGAAPRGQGTPEGGAATRPQVPGGEPAWLAELSARVAGRRRRRPNAQEHEQSLEFSFGEPAEPQPDAASGPRPAERGVDLAFEDPGTGAAPARAVQPNIAVVSPGARSAPAQPFRLRPEPARGVDVLLGSGAAQAAFAEGEPACAPLGPRFWAGVADAGVLIVAGIIFTAIFLLAGGRISVTPGDLSVVLFVVCFWIFVYFGVFSATVYSTPGQAAMRLRLRNLDGASPSLQEALLRAFGYLVSMASLMLGFLWAAMDSDGMAWHDHISGTVLVEED